MQRAKHMENHCRPWKCSVSGCDFAVIGFLTANGLEQHRRRVHLVVRESDYTQPSALDDEALHTLLYEQIESEHIDELEAIWPTCSEKMNDFTKAELIMLAAGQGSLPMVQLFLEWDKQKQEPRNTAVKFGSVINHAIQSGNLELSRWILDKATAWGGRRSGRYRDAVVAVLKSDSAEIFEIWENTITSIAPKSTHIAQELLEKTVLNTAKRFPDQELRMFETWRRLVDTGKVQPCDLGRWLTNVAQTTCSIEQAKLLLDLGAPIDYPQSERSRGYTALHWASKKTSEDAAHFMKFLLLKGACPILGFGNSRPAKEEGARRIETWLKMTWDELVEWAEQERGLRRVTRWRFLQDLKGDAKQRAAEQTH
ncbi:hypothetical protein VTI74DRAFT_3371 [Chaetomium olivicolor]